MSSPSIKLFRLRAIFVAYFVLKSLVGAWVAWSVLRKGSWRHLGKWEFSPGTVLAFSLMAAAVILIIALFIFGRLLQRRNWARVLLLVVGWLTVISAAFSLLASTQIADMGAWVSRWLPEMDWEKLMQFDRIQKVFELLFWGYVISVLQFDQAVRDEFFPREEVEKAPEK